MIILCIDIYIGHVDSGVLWVTDIKISSCWSWTIVDH